jgi:putative membrane protein
MMVWMVVAGFVGVALVALTTVGAVWLVRHSRPRPTSVPGQESPEEILRRRYAAGELDEDEFLRRRSGLMP